MEGRAWHSFFSVLQGSYDTLPNLDVFHEALIAQLRNEFTLQKIQSRDLG